LVSPGPRRALALPVVLSAVAVALLAGAGVVGYQRGRHRASDGEGDSRLRQAELEQQLIVLETRLRALERNRQALARSRLGLAPVEPQASANPPSVSGAPAPPLPGSRRAPPATADDERLYFAAIEARHGGETRDPAWAEPVEQKLRHSAEGLGTRLTIELARCGREMCRLDIRREVEPEADATVALQELVRRVVRVLPAALVQNTDDPRRLVVYLVREGAGGFPPLVGREPDSPATSQATP
jgi:hypothetical protein